MQMHVDLKAQAPLFRRSVLKAPMGLVAPMTPHDTLPSENLSFLLPIMASVDVLHLAIILLPALHLGSCCQPFGTFAGSFPTYSETECQ